MIYIGVDPGSRTGIAVIDRLGQNNELTIATTVPGDRAMGHLIEIIKENGKGKYVRVGVEKPRVYTQQHKWSGDPQHIVELALLAGKLAGVAESLGCWVTTPEPRRWRKGNAPKNVISKRVLAALTEAERKRIGRTSEHSRDAIGIAMFLANRGF